MNIYTLKFHEKGLESSYQNHKAGYLQIPILKFTYFLTIAIVGSNLIENMVKDDYTYFIAKLAIMTVIVGQCILFKYIKRFPNLAILIVNFSLMFLEGDFNSYKTSFDGYLFGSNQMLAHAILTIGQDFLFGVCTNISLGLVRAIITYVNTESLTVQQYLYTIIITLGFSGIVYQCEKYQRSSYLFQEKDTKWEKILPHVIEKPFLIFTFDKDQFSFQQIAINKSLTDSQEMQFDSVSDFLKECKYEKNNLQKYLFNKYQQFNYLQQKTQCEKIDIQYRKSRLRVKLLIYCIDTIRFMLIIEAVDQSYIDLKFKYSNQLKSMQLKYNNQLKKITKLLNKRLKKQFPQLLIDLRISIFEFKTLQSIRKSKVTQVDISLIFKKLGRIFEKSYKYKISFICKPNTSIHTYKPELYVFLLTIIKNSKPNQQLELIFDSMQDQSTPQLTLIGADKLPQDKQFKQCVQLLFQKHISVVNCNFFSQFQLIFGYLKKYIFPSLICIHSIIYQMTNQVLSISSCDYKAIKILTDIFIFVNCQLIMMIIRNLFRFHYTLPHRIIKTSYYLQNKNFIDSITQSPLSPEQLQKLIQIIPNVSQEEVKIGLMQVTLENCIMKEKLGEIKQLMKQYRELIDTAKYNEQDLQKHDLGDYYEKDALVLLRECKMQEAFEPFKKSLSYFLELSEKKEDYICRRIDQILETMIIVIEDMGQIEQAREHLKYGLEIFEKLMGKQSEKYIQYLNKLANTYLTIENQKAIQLHQEALNIIGPMNESNFKIYLKTAVELMITQSNESFDKTLYETINTGLTKFGSIDTELTVYYHVLMSHIFYENQDFEKQEYHLKKAYQVYEQEKSALLMNIIVQKSLILQSSNKEEFFLTLINELAQEFADSLELSYYRCKLLYKINEDEGIEEFKNLQNKLYNKRLTQFIVDFATDIAKDGLKLQAIELLKDYPEYNHLVKAWQNQ